MIVAKTLPKGLIPHGQTHNKQIIIGNTISKLSIISLLPKKENKDKKLLKHRQYLNLTEDISSQNNIITTQKQTKTDNSTHKLHSLHPFI